MNKAELVNYKLGLEVQLIKDELALKRLKSLVDHQKKYLKLIEEQIDMLSHTTEFNAEIAGV